MSIAITRIKQPVRNIFFFLFLTVSGGSVINAQSSCLLANAEVLYVCPTDFGDNLNVGIGTRGGSVYNWYRGNTRIGGPLTGTGNAESLGFFVSSHSTAGHYRVERTQEGFPATCEYNKLVKYSEPIGPITITNITANSVSFSWTTQGRYRYEVTTNNYYSELGTITEGNSVTVNNLSGGTQFYIFMKGYGDFEECYSDPGQSTTFTTLAGPCYPEINNSNIEGAINYCPGTNTNLSVSNLSSDNTYTWLKNGSPVGGGTFSSGTLSYSAPYNSGMAGVYSVRASKAGCLNADFGSVTIGTTTAVTGLNITATTEGSISFNWNSSGTGVNYEYEVTTTPTPPEFPQFSNKTNGTVTGLNAGTNYYVHVRPYCGSLAFPWTTTSVTTLPFSPLNCSTPAIINESSLMTAVLAAGAGSWDFTGTFPTNSAGYPTPGKEALYSFTPLTTGVYYLDIAPRTDGTVSYLYKPAATGCNNTGWKGIVAASGGYGGAFGKFPIGQLQAGVNYLFVLDNCGTEESIQAFKLSKANVALPTATNNCLPVVPLRPYYIPANFPGEHFIIDTAGNLVASVDFSEVTTGLSGTTMNYYVNSGTIRRDNHNREYLNRNFQFVDNWFYSGYGKLKIKLFFTNSELQSLINEPNDGIADVTGLNDLRASIGSDCYSIGQDAGYPLEMVTRGAYDANSSYVSFKTENSGSFFLHGGSGQLNEAVFPNYTQSFDSSFLINSWGQFNVVGNGLLTTETSKTNPLITPTGDPRFIFFDARNLPNNTETRLISIPILTTGIPSVAVEFSWLNSHILPYTDNAEGVQLEYSLNGTTWISTGTFVPRHDASLPAGTTKWNRKKIVLPAEAGNKPYIYVGFKFRSKAGSSCALDQASIIITPPCSSILTGLVTTAISTSSVNFSWTTVSGAVKYEYYVTQDPRLPDYGNETTSLSASESNLESGKTYYIHVRPFCTSTNNGSWTTIKFKTGTICPGGNITFNTGPVQPNYSYQWQVNTGSGWSNISNSAVYSGATTPALTLTGIPVGYEGYRYRVGYTYIPYNSTFYTEPYLVNMRNTWVGGNNTLWSNPLNWTCGVPDQYSIVYIPFGTPNSPTVSVNATCKNLLVEPGATVNITGTAKLTVTGAQ